MVYLGSAYEIIPSSRPNSMDIAFFPAKTSSSFKSLHARSLSMEPTPSLAASFPCKLDHLAFDSFVGPRGELQTSR